MLQCNDGGIPEQGFFRAENDVNNDTSCPIFDIQVSRNVICHHDLHPDRQFDGFR